MGLAKRTAEYRAARPARHMAPSRAMAPPASEIVSTLCPSCGLTTDLAVSRTPLRCPRCGDILCDSGIPTP